MNLNVLRSNYVRLKVLNASQSHLYWHQLCFVFRLFFAISVIILLYYNWSALSSFNLVDTRDFLEFSINESDFTYPDELEYRAINYQYSHPSQSICHFPLLKTEDQSILPFVEHSRKIICPQTNYEDLVSQDSDGTFLIANPVNGKLLRNEYECFYKELSGALYPKIAEYSLSWQWKRLPINRRFKMDNDQFVIKCWSHLTRHTVYHNAFANIPHRLTSPPSKDRYNIAILQIDSTSRNQFYRHAPKTLRFMRQNDFQILRGYTKVGDNSAINSLALLAGYGFEAKYRGLDKLLDESRLLNENQTFDDIFKHVTFLFDNMKRDGCATMFNDDIGKPEGGLFHYQAFNGFRKQPTEYYFRPYYTYIYKNLNAQSACLNGEFAIPKWLQLWERFSTLYKDNCHFSFNHISYFTHSNGNNLEFYDDLLNEALGRMKNNGVFDNTVLLILGDHGQRIHKIKHTYYGKIEERMPLAALYLPHKFRKSQPKLYKQLIQNTNRFTSTFDLHETLKELTQMRLTNNSIVKNAKKVGRSLFGEIPIERNCTDAKVPDNFCVCMNPIDEGIDTASLEPKIDSLIYDYFNQRIPRLNCISKWGINNKSQSKLMVYAVTSLVRFGPRYIEEWEKRIASDPNKANIFREIVDVEKNVTIWLQLNNSSSQHLQLDSTFRFQYNRITKSLDLLEEAWIRNAPCSIFQIVDLCKCF